MVPNPDQCVVDQGARYMGLYLELFAISCVKRIFVTLEEIELPSVHPHEALVKRFPTQELATELQAG